ncbi:hypothetical protein [Anaeromyxobacter diazotrophicus]|uniref:Uncharacterized protein n=1 Tax=Anaeromyxobacter diazotrophicus TaxID=2590199 RepID=A0A7I9VKL9_9BACT|nr:hypothetical protein [Anaeromyxobacter diazotrophicus]GEJ56728.1 hypothetical protein AMYX_14690 [Anaeromyxobacter diazotrophicus]
MGASRHAADSSGAIRFSDEPATPCCQGDELRCGCGSLLARIVGPAVELKCRRCKRVWNIPIEKS